MDTNEILDLAEYELLYKLFAFCDYCDPDDNDLHDTGAHRELFDCIRTGFGIDVKEGRGPAYHKAASLLKLNKKYRASLIQTIIEKSGYTPERSDLLDWFKYFMDTCNG